MLLTKADSSDILRAKTHVSASNKSPDKINHSSSGLGTSEKNQDMVYVTVSGVSKSMAGEQHPSQKDLSEAEEQKNEINRFGIKIDMSRETIDQMTDYEDRGYKPCETLFR